jgi:hypothetical protein
MSTVAVPPTGLTAPSPRATVATPGQLHIVAWEDPIADPHGVHPCSRYVELYWLGILGPSATWLLRRISYGLEMSAEGFDLDLSETARSLGLGDRMGKNSPFRRALHRLSTFELARAHGPGALAVRTHIPPLPLRHLTRLPESIQASHRRWQSEQRLSGPEQMKKRAGRLAAGLAASGLDQTAIERRLAEWQFHPAVAFRAAEEAATGVAETGTGGSVHRDAQPTGVRTKASANASEVISSTKVRTPNPVPPLVK